MNATIIEVKKLSKDFSGKKVLDNIRFEIRPGECLAIVGENGSGKSTLINIAADILKPSDGKITIFGKAHNLPETKKLRGVVFQENRLDGLFSGKELLEFQGMFYGLDKKKIKENSKRLLELVDLIEDAEKPVLTYSAGMKKRLEIAKALMADPKILLLDEPTSELDANIKQKMWEYIRETKNKLGLTILLTTHDLREAVELSDRIIVLDKKVLLEVDAHELSKTKTAMIIKSSWINKIKQNISSLGWKSKKINSNTVMVLAAQEKEKTQATVINTFKGIEIQEIDVHEFSLADLFKWSEMK